MTVQSFNNQIISRNTALTLAGRTLSGDFAFKAAYASGSPRTVQSALENQRLRIDADLMLLLTLDGHYISTSGMADDQNLQTESTFPFPDFIRELENTGETSGMILFEEQLYSIIAVPLLTPVPSAWIVLGFIIDDQFINELQQESRAQISVLNESNGSRSIQISTLNEEQKTDLTHAINGGEWLMQSVYEMTLQTHAFISYISSLPSWGNDHIYAILQRDRDEAMAPYFRIRILLIGLSFIALLFSIFGGAAIASSVTRPVQLLAGFARDIQQGNYSREVEVKQKDELGQLATAFNDMSKGLYERDKVRNLLGKVISPEIAEELINKDVQLGGEEKVITVLFTDLRGFTNLSENRPPQEVLDFLNAYLTGMTSVIDKHGGVVDKYIGDAIMALFGAPLELKDHASRAVACGMEMIEQLAKSNEIFKDRNWPELAMGVGINTGTVVVGNMGSKDRLNYTAIGDAVNLASRLESVTKEYNAPVIVSEATMQQATEFHYEKLDRIQVKGKQEAVTIYTPTSRIQ